MSDSEIEEVFTNNRNSNVNVNIGKSDSSINVPRKKNRYIHSDNESLNEDELGLDFLANPNQISRSKPTVNQDILIDSDSDDESVVKEHKFPINVNNDDDDHLDLNGYTEPKKNFDEVSYGSGDKHSVFMDNERSEYDMSQAEIVKEKRRLLFKLFRYKKKGINLSENFNMNSNLESLIT